MDFLASNSHRISSQQALTRELCPEIAAIILAEIIKIWRRRVKDMLSTYLWIPSSILRPDKTNRWIFIWISFLILNICFHWGFVVVGCCYTSGVNWTWLYYRWCYWIFYKTIPQNIISLWNIYYIRIYCINSL